MPRGGGKSSMSRPAPARSAPPPAARQAPPPAAKQAPPPAAAPAPMQQQQSGGGMLSGLGGAMVQGFGFGAGSAIGRAAVGSMFGGSGSSAPEVANPPQQAPVAPANDKCSWNQVDFNKCMQDNSNNIAVCDSVYQALRQCQMDSN